MMSIESLKEALIGTTRAKLEGATQLELEEIECELWNLLTAVETHLKRRDPGYVSIIETEGRAHAER